MSILQYIGYRPFKSEIDIRNIIVKELEASDSIYNLANAYNIKSPHAKISLKKSLRANDIQVLKIFETTKQQTWIIRVLNELYCLLDDIELEMHENKEYIKWKTPINELKISVKNSAKNNKFGLIDFNDNHKRWYYSKRLLDEASNAQFAINNLIYSSWFIAQNIYSLFENRLVTIEFLQGSESATKYGKYITGYLWYPEANNDTFYGTIKFNEFKSYNHQLLKLGFKLTSGAKAVYNITEETEKKLLNQEGFLCSDIGDIIYDDNTIPLQA